MEGGIYSAIDDGDEMNSTLLTLCPTLGGACYILSIYKVIRFELSFFLEVELPNSAGSAQKTV
jgi:hypothetical protein